MTAPDGLSADGSAFDGFGTFGLEIPFAIHAEMVAHAIAGFPLEACGLFAGPGAATRTESLSGQGSSVSRFYATENEAASAKVYTVPGVAFLRSEMDAEDNGWELLGVMHSHTHTDAYPSPTDVAQAPDPNWHYVIVSLRDDLPSLRSYRIVDGEITEEPVRLTD